MKLAQVNRRRPGLSKTTNCLQTNLSQQHDHQRPDQYHHHEKVSSHQIHALIRECELFSLAPNSCVDEIADYYSTRDTAKGVYC